MAKLSAARKMRKQYCQLLPLLAGTAKFVERVLEDLPRQDFDLQTDIKQYKRTVEKAGQRKIKDLTELSDLVRGRLFFSDNYEMEEVIKLLKELFDDVIEITKIESKHDKRNDVGLEYDGVVHMDLKVGDLPFELQIMPVEFKNFKPMLHKIYQELRTGAVPEPRAAALRDLHNKIYKKLDEKAKKNRKETSDD